MPAVPDGEISGIGYIFLKCHTIRNAGLSAARLKKFHCIHQMPTTKSSVQQSIVSQHALLLPQTHHQNSMLQHRVCYQRSRYITYWHSELLLLWNGCMLSKTVIPRKQKLKGEFKLQICIFSNWGHWNFQHLTGSDIYLLLMAMYLLCLLSQIWDCTGHRFLGVVFVAACS